MCNIKVVDDDGVGCHNSLLHQRGELLDKALRLSEAAAEVLRISELPEHRHHFDEVPDSFRGDLQRAKPLPAHVGAGKVDACSPRIFATFVEETYQLLRLLGPVLFHEERCVRAQPRILERRPCVLVLVEQQTREAADELEVARALEGVGALHVDPVEDGGDFDPFQFTDEALQKFRFILLSSCEKPDMELVSRFHVMRVVPGNGLM